MTTGLKTSVVAGVAALALTIGAPVFVAAQQDQPRRGPGVEGQKRPGPGGPGMRMRGPGGPGGVAGFRGLDLSDDQKAQLKKIAESHQAEFRAIGEKTRAAHEGMRALIDADTIDESAIRAKSQEVAAAQAEAMILNAKIRKESLQILTADQLAKLKERREARPDGPRKRRGPQQ
ncbi:MAG TPA: Spy/CpxP family protein refolding chaperone [Vicinamibacterales bacterium]|nr:Spy/CpxP family protein refolding chaperone [Vicinamibacterales bacterium]